MIKITTLRGKMQNIHIKNDQKSHVTRRKYTKNIRSAKNKRFEMAKITTLRAC